MAYADAAKGNCVLGVWPLDETEGTVGRSLTGRLTVGMTIPASGVTLGLPGPSSHLPRSVETDGATGYLTLPPMGTNLTTAGTPQAWSFWFYAPAAISSASPVRYLIGSPQGRFIWLGSSTGTLANEVVAVGNGSGNNTGWSGFTIAEGWRHLLLAYSGATNGWTLYVDAVATGTKIAASGGCPGLTSSGIEYRIGNNGTTFHTVVRVAGVSIYSHHLSASEITRIYQAGRNGFRNTARLSAGQPAA